MCVCVCVCEIKYTFNSQTKWFSGRIYTNHNAKKLLNCSLRIEE